MTKRMILPLLFGLVGAAILISLGTWQMRRLAWKEGILAEIEARIHAPAGSLPAAPVEGQDKYAPVSVRGQFLDREIRVLVSQKLIGAGYRIITPLDTGKRTILIDRGFLGINDAAPATPAGEVTITGNLHWPDEITSSTPDPDLGRNIWFARDLPAMAMALETDQILVIARETSFSDSPISPLPVDISGIPNDHLIYAITWFSLAAVWLGMTALLLWRIRQQTE